MRKMMRDLFYCARFGSCVITAAFGVVGVVAGLAEGLDWGALAIFATMAVAGLSGSAFVPLFPSSDAPLAK